MIYPHWYDVENTTGCLCGAAVPRNCCYGGPSTSRLPKASRFSGFKGNWCFFQSHHQKPKCDKITNIYNDGLIPLIHYILTIYSLINWDLYVFTIYGKFKARFLRPIFAASQYPWINHHPTGSSMWPVAPQNNICWLKTLVITHVIT